MNDVEYLELQAAEAARNYEGYDEFTKHCFRIAWLTRRLEFIEQERERHWAQVILRSDQEENL